MKIQIPPILVALFLIPFLLLLLLSSCSQEEQLAPLEEPTTPSTPAPSPTRNATLTPKPQPSATATATAALQAAELLGAALAHQEEIESYHFTMQMEMGREAGGPEETVALTFSGDYLAPDTMGGLMTMNVGGFSVESEMTAAGEELYITNPDTGAWESASGEFSDMPNFDPWNASSAKLQVEDFKSLRVVGLEEKDGRSLIHISGQVPGSKFPDQDLNLLGDVQVDYWVDAAENLIYAIETTMSMPEVKIGGIMNMTTVLDYSKFNEPVSIEIPEVPPRWVRSVDTDLGILYQAPSDWTAEKSGGESCAEGGCPRTRLIKFHTGGTNSSILFSAVNPQALADLEADLQDAGYQETVIGDLPALWLERDVQAGGLIILDEGQAVFVSSQWIHHPEDGDTIQEIIASVQPVKTATSMGFEPYDLPGFARLEMPADWFSIRSESPGRAAVSSQDVDMTYYQFEDGGVVVMLFSFGDPLRPALDSLKEDYLAYLAEGGRLLSGPEAVNFNGQEAATASYNQNAGFVEDITLYRASDGSQTIALLAITPEEDLARHQPVLAAIKQSVSVYPQAPGPAIDPLETPPGDYKSHEDQRLAYHLAYPGDWSLVDMNEMIFLNPPAISSEELTDSMLGTIIIYPQMSPLDPGGDEVDEIFFNLWTYAWLIVRDPLLSSEVSGTTVKGIDYRAAYFVATNEEDGSKPLYGFLGVVTNGESAVGLMSWVEDPDGYEALWTAVFNSIQLAETAVLERGSAQIIEPGQLVEGKMGDGQEQLFTLTAKTGESYFLITRVDQIGRLEIFNPDDAHLAEVNYITEFFPALQPFTAEKDGEFVIAIKSSYASTTENLSLLVLPLDESHPGVVDLALGEINGSCGEFGYTKIVGEKFIVYATPTGPEADDTDLAVEIIGSSGDLLWEQHNHATTGQPIAFEYTLPEDGNFMVRVCERNDQPAAFDLIVLALTAELGAPKAIRSILDLDLAEGDEQEGAEVYEHHGCSACHGDPAQANSNMIGPDLNNIGATAGERAQGLSAAGYILTSLQDPNAHLAPQCPNGLPCAEGVMPTLRDVVDDPDGLADLIAYLLTFQGAEPALNQTSRS